MKLATTAKLPKKTSAIVSRGLEPSLTQAQKLELDRRLADHLANPDDVIAWDDVKAAALAKISQ